MILDVVKGDRDGAEIQQEIFCKKSKMPNVANSSLV